MTQTQDKLSEHISVKEAQMAEVLAKLSVINTRG